MLVEAMKQALEALETLDSGDSYKTHNAATALRQAIEQAEEQEPVAWMFQHEETGRMHYVSNDGMHSPESFLSMNPRCKFVCALYTRLPQREWVSLTDEEIAVISGECAPVSPSDLYFARAIEAKLKEKNAYGWQSVANPTEYLDDLRGGADA